MFLPFVILCNIEAALQSGFDKPSDIGRPNWTSKGTWLDGNCDTKGTAVFFFIDGVLESRTVTAVAGKVHKFKVLGGRFDPEVSSKHCSSVNEKAYMILEAMRLKEGGKEWMSVLEVDLQAANTGWEEHSFRLPQEVRDL